MLALFIFFFFANELDVARVTDSVYRCIVTADYWLELALSRCVRTDVFAIIVVIIVVIIMIVMMPKKPVHRQHVCPIKLERQASADRTILYTCLWNVSRAVCKFRLLYVWLGLLSR